MSQTGKGVFLTIEVDDEGTGVVKNFEEQYKKAMDRVKQSNDQAGQASKAFNDFSNSVAGVTVKLAAMAGVAYGGSEIAGLIKDTALLSARYETLGVVSDIVARNMGYTKGEMDKLTLSVKQQGISLLASRESVIRMGQAHMEMTKAAQLARAAQDAAVVGGVNSSEALQRMTYGIQSAQVEVLRTIGLNVNFENGYARVAKQLGITVEQLTEQQKVQSRTNDVLTAATAISGSYEAAMGTAGKKMTSLARYSEDLQIVLGQTFSDVLVIGVDKLTGGLLSANSAAKELAANGLLEEWGMKTAKSLAFVADSAYGSFKALDLLRSGVSLWGAALSEEKGAINIALQDIRNTWNETLDGLSKNSFRAEANKYFEQKAREQGRKAAIAFNDELQKNLDANPFDNAVYNDMRRAAGLTIISPEGPTIINAAHRAMDNLGSSVGKTTDEQKKLNSELQKLQDVIATAGMSDYEKQQYKIRVEFERSITSIDGMNTEQNKLIAGRARDAEAMELQHKQIEKLDAIMKGVQEDIDTAGLDEWGKKFYKLNEQHLELVDKIKKESEGLIKSGQMTSEALDAMLAKEEERNRDEQARIERDQQQAHLDEQKKLLKEQEDASQKSFDTVAGFFRDSLVQMDSSAGSFVDGIISKLKNLAASVAANALASLTMQAGYGLTSMLGIGGFGSPSGGGFSLGGLLGMGGGGASGSSGGGMNLMSLLSGGKTAYNIYQNGGSYFSNLFSQPTSYIASEGGSPYMVADALDNGAAQYIQSLNWTGMAAGGLGMLAGGYGMYNAYGAGSPGMGALSGAGFGLGATGLGISSGVLTGAAAGSWAPVVGTIIGAAIGGIVGALGMGQASAALKEQRLAANYYRGIGRAANADISNMTLNQYVAGGSSILNPEAVAAASKLGGMDSTTTAEMYRVQDIMTGYKKAVEESGGASAQALGQYQRINVELEALKAKAAGATGATRDLLNEFVAIAEKTKTLQIKELTTDLTSGVGLFSSTVDKLKDVGMDKAEYNKLVNAEALKFLTSDTLPALDGKLTRVREEFKKTSEELASTAQHENDAAIKAKILTSDMALTEAQLRTLKLGTVNSDLIAIYTALGKTDEVINLVTVDTNKTVSAFQAMKDASDSLQSGIDGLAAMYKNIDSDKIPQGLMAAYGALQQVSSTMAILSEAGLKASNLPEVFDEMKVSIQNADLPGLNAELMDVTNTMLYLSAATGQLGMSNIANVLASMGTVAGDIAAAIELLMVVKRIGQGVAEKLVQNDDIYNWGKTQLEKLENLFPALGKKWGEAWDLARNPVAVAGTIDDIINPVMTWEASNAIAAKYTQAEKYKGLSGTALQAAQINNEADLAVAAQQKKYDDLYASAMKNGKISEDEKAALQGVQELIAAIKNGAKQATEDIIAQAKKSFTSPLDDIINTAGMSDLDKQLYNLASRYAQQKETLDGLGLSAEDYASALGKLDKVFGIEGATAINTYYDAITKSIGDYENTLKLSKYNVFSNPDQMGKDFVSQYNSSLEAFKAASPGNEAAAWQTMQNDSQAALDYMFQLYGSSDTYRAFYDKVQQELKAAQAEMIAAKSAENDSLENLKNVAGNTEATVSELKNVKAEILALRSSIQAMNAILSGLAAATGQAVAANLPESKR